MTVGEAELGAMRRAIALAGQTHPHPNPRVGAVILDSSGATIAEGFHHGPGRPHAEREALSALSAPIPEGATLVVSLEPCHHHGRTPPCTEAIVQAGITRVVVGAVDPDPRVSGLGLEALRGRGVAVVAGILDEEVEASDPAYFHHRRTGRPRITLKSAVTLDGQIAALDGTSRWITGLEARRDAQELRKASDAVMVGAGTIRTDDPELTVRLDDHRGRQPVAVVVQGRRPLPPEAAVWGRSDTVVITTREPELGVDHIVVGAGSDGRPDPGDVAAALADRGLLAVLMEGGATLARALWSAGLVDHGVTYVGARVAGGVGLPMLAGHWETMDDATPVRIRDVRAVGSDLRIEWFPVRE